MKNRIIYSTVAALLLSSSALSANTLCTFTNNDPLELEISEKIFVSNSATINNKRLPDINKIVKEIKSKKITSVVVALPSKNSAKVDYANIGVKKVDSKVLEQQRISTIKSALSKQLSKEELKSLNIFSRNIDNSCVKGGQSSFALRKSIDPVKISTVTPQELQIASTSPMGPSNSTVAPAKELPSTQVSGDLYSITLPNNGLIWSTEDPSVAKPALQASTLSYVGFEAGAITTPIEFYLRSNYAAFIDKMEIRVFRESDNDLIEPLAIIDVKPASFTRVKWDAKLPSQYNFKVGDRLVYIVKAYDKSGQFDETYRQSIQLLKPEDVKKSMEDLQKSVAKEQGTLLNTDLAVSQLLLNNAFAGNGLSKQNIPVRGSKVVIRGVNLPNSALYINGEQFPIDLQKKFEAEYIVPSGTHLYKILLQDNDKTIAETLRVDATGNYFFGIAMADFTLSKAKISGKGANEIFDEDADDLFKDGRLAFYVKGKVQNRFLITAQADTTQRDIKDMFKGFTKANPTDVFRSLDPDMYYPTYGDDSTTFRDVDTQGKFYLRVDWDKNHALWGNFNTGFTGTQYAQYSRSLYGAALEYRSTGNNAYGDANTIVRAFVSEAKSASGHSEFLGTGGSLYYLPHANILGGSEKIVLQVKDISTGRVLANINLERGVDYEISDIQGRVILSRPLSQITKMNLTSITTQAPLDGYEQRLIIDYEWTPSEFDDDMISAGIRAKQWIGDHVAVGGTYVREEQDGDNYQIAGADLTLQAGKGTYIKGEYTQTKSSGAPILYSDNGGLSFVPLGSVASSDKGGAAAIDAKVNFKELGVTSNELSIGAWWRDTKRGYSSSRSSASGDLSEYGAELVAQITRNWKIYSQVSKASRDGSEHIQAQVTTDVQITSKAKVSAEVKHTDTKNSVGESSHGTIGALRADYDITPNINIYTTGQLTIDNDGGKYANNDAVTLGTRYIFTDSSSLSAEYTTGHRGDAFSVDASYQMNPDHNIYGGYTWANTRTSDFDSAFNMDKRSGWTLGQRWNLSNQVTLYNESQLLRDKESLNNVGMDFYLGEGWNLGLMYQKGKVPGSSTSQKLDRDAVSFSIGRTSSMLNWMSRLEFRKDSGAQSREQWVSTNRITYKVNESLRLAGRFNYSDTDDKLDSTQGAKFIESNLGFAYRPFDSTKWGFFGRYTYLYDLSTLGQVNGVDYDQKSQILSLEGVYKHDGNWEFALKVAGRAGEARYGRGAGQWFDSKTIFYAAQVRYDLLAKWHAMVEYRALKIKDGGLKHGFMIGVDRDITENFRVGAGYNFTDFSDDLTKLDYKYRGWFINVLGTY